MALGPIEVLEIAFPGNQFNGAIIPELERLVENDTIAVIDGVAIVKGEDGEVEFVEFGQDGASESVQRLANLLDQVEAFISDDDIEQLASGLAPNSTGAILVFEHTWAKPFRDALVDAGGILAANFRVPAATVDALLDELDDLDDD
ncbi:DUF6325 family protein [Ilumatobacter nonamiensis]|uniref:DUF6325 family protein n=1 Tax=Ilumatobacter nonamiensis TaxID=467093 RepID=UPI000344A056|nr:DUF6325 family protein [Ilumatobacter nonamiensis]